MALASSGVMGELVSGGVEGADESISGEEDFSLKLAADTDAICGACTSLFSVVLWALCAKLLDFKTANDTPKSSEIRKTWATVHPLREINLFMALSSI
jgi:hypothetical protein